MVFELPFALFLQARNRPVGQSQLANQSARYIGYKPQLEKNCLERCMYHRQPSVPSWRV